MMTTNHDCSVLVVALTKLSATTHGASLLSLGQRNNAIADWQLSKYPGKTCAKCSPALKNTPALCRLACIAPGTGNS